LSSANLVKRSLSALATAAVLFILACSKSSTPAASTPQNPAATETVVRLDPAIDALGPKDARLEKVAGGFSFTEGPVWRPGMGLWFSDLTEDVVRQWSPKWGVSEMPHLSRAE